MDIGPQYKLYDGQESAENLRYEIVRDGSKANRTAGQQGNMTLAAPRSFWRDKGGHSMHYLIRYLIAAGVGALVGVLVWWVNRDKTDRYYEEELQ